LVRHSPGVSPEQVVTPMQAAVSSLIMKTRLGSEARAISLAQPLGRRARQEAWRATAALFSYSYYAAEAFAPGPMRPEFRFLFQLHPHPKTVRKLLSEELERVPKFAASLRWEHEIGAPESHFNALCSEPTLANGWVSGSRCTG